MQCITFLLYYLSETDPKEIETHGYLLIGLCMSWNMSFGCFQSVLHFHTIDPPRQDQQNLWFYHHPLVQCQATVSTLLINRECRVCARDPSTCIAQGL